MAISVVRLGSPRAANEGPRLGTVRRPPRGVKKEDFASRDFYDVWLPDLSPTDPATADLDDKLEFALGRSLAVAATPRDERLDVAARCAATPTAAEQGTALARTLRVLDVRAVRVVGDGSARAMAFDDAVTARAGAMLGIQTDESGSAL